MQEAGIEPRPPSPQVGMITTTLPASWLLGLEIFKIIKCYPILFRNELTE